MSKVTIWISAFRSFLRRNKILFEVFFGIIAATGVLYAIFHPNIKENTKSETAQPQKQERQDPTPVKHLPPPPLSSKAATHKKTEIKPKDFSEPNPPQINASNSVVSIDQKGGITAGTVINADTVTITAPQKRRISPEQLQILLPALRQLCGTKIKIKYATGDQEQKQFAEDIINAFRTAGCTPDIPTPPRVRISAYGKGLSFSLNETPPHPPGAALLQQALQHAHIDSQWYGFSKMERGLLVVYIGERP